MPNEKTPSAKQTQQEFSGNKMCLCYNVANLYLAVAPEPNRLIT